MLPEIWGELSDECHYWNGTPFNQTSFLVTSDWRMDNLRWLAYKISMPTIIVFGLIGNILNLLVLSKPTLKGVIYIYLSSLAIADLGVMLLAIPMVIRLAQGISFSYAAAIYHSHLELPLVNTMIGCSVLVIVCVTVDRYISVCLPTKFRSVHTYRTARIAIATSWALATAISCPLAILKKVCILGGLNEKHYAFQENLSITNSTAWILYIGISEILVRLGPAVILAVLNIFIIHKFRSLKTNRNRFREASDKFRERHYRESIPNAEAPKKFLKSPNLKEEHRIIILLTAIIILFFVTMTPSSILSLIYTQKWSSNFNFQVFRAVANNLEMCNFALNFYIYFLCSKEFRREFISLFSCSACRPVSNNLQKTTNEEENPDEDKGEDKVEFEDFSKNGTTVRQSPDNISMEVDKMHE